MGFISYLFAFGGRRNPATVPNPGGSVSQPTFGRSLSPPASSSADQQEENCFTAKDPAIDNPQNFTDAPVSTNNPAVVSSNASTSVLAGSKRSASPSPVFKKHKKPKAENDTACNENSQTVQSDTQPVFSSGGSLSLPSVAPAGGSSNAQYHPTAQARPASPIGGSLSLPAQAPLAAQDPPPPPPMPSAPSRNTTHLLDAQPYFSAAEVIQSCCGDHLKGKACRIYRSQCGPTNAHLCFPWFKGKCSHRSFAHHARIHTKKACKLPDGISCSYAGCEQVVWVYHVKQSCRSLFIDATGPLPCNKPPGQCMMGHDYMVERVAVHQVRRAHARYNSAT